MNFAEYLHAKKLISNKKISTIKSVLLENSESVDKIIQAFDEYISEYLKNPTEKNLQHINTESKATFDSSKIKDVVSKKEWLDLLENLNSYIAQTDKSEPQGKALLLEVNMFAKRLCILTGDIPQIDLLVNKISFVLDKIKSGENSNLLWGQVKEYVDLGSLFFEDVLSGVNPDEAWGKIKIAF